MIGTSLEVLLNCMFVEGMKRGCQAVEMGDRKRWKEKERDGKEDFTTGSDISLVFPW